MPDPITLYFIIGAITAVSIIAAGVPDVAETGPVHDTAGLILMCTCLVVGAVLAGIIWPLSLIVIATIGLVLWRRRAGAKP